MGRARHVARVVREETRKQSEHLVELGADCRIELESFLKQSFGIDVEWIRLIKDKKKATCSC